MLIRVSLIMLLLSEFAMAESREIPLRTDSGLFPEERGRSTLGSRRSALNVRQSDGGVTGSGMEKEIFAAQQEPYDLEGLAAKAVNVHPIVRSKRAEFEASSADIDAVRWEFFPTPSIRKEVDNRRASMDATVFSIQQPIWTGGRLSSALDAAKARNQASDYAIGEAQYDTAFRVTVAYRAWFSAKGRRGAFQRGLERHEHYLRSIERRALGGISADVDRELVISRLSQLQSDLEAARALEDTALMQLSQLTGTALKRDSVARVPISRDTLPAIDEVLAKVFASYPQLQRLGREVEVSRANVRQRNSALWPSLSMRAEHVTGGGGYFGGEADNRVLLQVDFSPGAGLSKVSEGAAAEARVKGAIEAKSAAEVELVGQVRSDYDTYIAAVQQDRFLRRTKSAATEILESYDRQYRVGRRSWVDVMNAARELIQVETSIVDVHATLVASQFRLRLFRGDVPWNKVGRQ